MVRPDIPRLAEAHITAKGRRLIRVRHPRPQQDALVVAVLMGAQAVRVDPSCSLRFGWGGRRSPRPMATPPDTTVSTPDGCAIALDRAKQAKEQPLRPEPDTCASGCLAMRAIGHAACPKARFVIGVATGIDCLTDPSPPPRIRPQAVGTSREEERASRSSPADQVVASNTRRRWSVGRARYGSKRHAKRRLR